MIERDQQGNRLCTMPYFSERDLHSAIWPWLTDIMKQPEQAIRAMQAKAQEHQGQADGIRERLARIETRLAEVRRRIANLDDQLEVETETRTVTACVPAKPSAQRSAATWRLNMLT